MSGQKSRRKGARGEREWAEFLRNELGCEDAHRGRQYHGGHGTPDVAAGVPNTHAEVKRCERLSLYEAIAQAVADAEEDDVPYVAHRRNGKDWLVCLRAIDLESFADALCAHRLRADAMWCSRRPRNWHFDFVALCEHLVREHGFTAEQILPVIKKPWKWEAEVKSLRTFGSAYPEIDVLP